MDDAGLVVLVVSLILLTLLVGRWYGYSLSRDASRWRSSFVIGAVPLDVEIAGLLFLVVTFRQVLADAYLTTRNAPFFREERAFVWAAATGVFSASCQQLN